MQRHLRYGALVATSGLLAAGIAPMLTAPAANAASPTQASADAATWLANALSDGLVKNADGTPNYDASVDAALALSGAGSDKAQAASNAVAAAATAYTEYQTAASDGTYVGTYAGHVAKLLALEVAVPPSPAPAYQAYTWKPTDTTALATPPSPPRAEGIGELEEKLIDNMSDTGQIQDNFSVDKSGTVTNGFGVPSDPQHTTQTGQAYAVNALSAGVVPTDGSTVSATDLSTKAALALGFLQREQATGGGFCVEQTTVACGAPDVLTTAQVMLQLQQVKGDNKPLANAMAGAAAGWLAAQQKNDGSFGDAVMTGAAGAALSGTYNAELAAVWLRQNQANDGFSGQACADALTPETGAVALTLQARNAGRAGGIAAVSKVDWERATTAAIPALDNLPPKPAADVTFVGPSGFRKAGAELTYDVANEAPGDLVCITGPNGSLTRGWADVNGHAAVDLVVPNTTIDATYTLHDHTGTDRAVVTRVLGPKKFSLSAVKRRKRGHIIRIRIYGLQSNESYYVKFRTIRITKAGVRAPASGSVTVPYVIRRKAKLGKAKITVVGQTGDRNQVRWLRVIR